MTGPGSVPDETKWRIAAEFAATLPALYDQVFRGKIGEQYDGLEQEVWMEASRIIGEIAGQLNLPAGNALELAESLRTILIILFGPGFRSESLDVSKDGAVIVIRKCPLISAAYHAGNDGDRTFHKCMAFTLSGVPGLNRDFSVRFVRTMCSGDRQCEIKVERNEPPAAGGKTAKQ